MKTVDVTVVLHVKCDVSDEWDEQATKFFIEQNHCIDNHITSLGFEDNGDMCRTCNTAKAFIGKIPFEEIAKIEKK